MQEIRHRVVTSEDYARAERLLWAVLGEKIKNKPVSPTWIGMQDIFWYRRDVPGGHRYVLVEAATGVTRPLFDHEALASLLADQFGETELDARALPLGGLTVSDDLASASFRIGPNAYRAALSPLHVEREEVPETRHDLRVSPDGNWAVSVQAGNLWLTDLSTGAKRPLTQDGAPDNGYGIYYDNWKGSFVARERSGRVFPPFGVLWSPDSRRVIVPRIDQSRVGLYPFVESAPKDGYRPKVHMAHVPLMGEEPPATSWYIFNIPDGEMRQIRLPPGLLCIHQDLLPIQRAWWSSDGRHRYVLAHGRYMQSAHLFDIDLNSGDVRTMVEEHLLPRTNLNGMFYNPPNVWLSGDGREAVWYSQRSGTGHLYLYDTRTSQLKHQITSGDWFVRDIIHVDGKAREILFTGSGREGGNPYYRSLYRIGFDGGAPRRLTHEPFDQEIISPQSEGMASFELSMRQMSPSGKYIVHAYSTVNQPPKSVIRELSEGRIVADLGTADISAATAEGYRAPETFDAKAANGKSDLYGVLYLPADFDPNGSYPIIVSQYTSPIGPASPKTFIRAMTGTAGPVSPGALAALGFAVLTLDPRGTSFRSREFESAIDGRLHILGMDDYAAAIEQLGVRHPYLDTSRVGIYGGSFGGLAVIRAMLEFPDVFKVGVASVPPASMQSVYPDYHWYAYHGEPRYADGSGVRPTPLDTPLNYENLNANAQVDRLRGKLMLIFGELDENVLPASTLQFIAALIEDDRPFDMLVLPGANHFSAPRTRHTVRRHFDYFVQHLLGAVPPSDFRFTVLPQFPEPDFGEEIW